MEARSPFHASLASGRWQTFKLVEQLSHIGSEVDRAICTDRAGRLSRRDAAIDRALELFDLTAADDRWCGHRRREVLRAREEFGRLFFSEDVPSDSAEGLSKYFLYFAIAARRSDRHRPRCIEASTIE